MAALADETRHGFKEETIPGVVRAEFEDDVLMEQLKAARTGVSFKITAKSEFVLSFALQPLDAPLEGVSMGSAQHPQVTPSLNLTSDQYDDDEFEAEDEEVEEEPNLKPRKEAEEAEEEIPEQIEREGSSPASVVSSDSSKNAKEHLEGDGAKQDGNKDTPTYLYKPSCLEVGTIEHPQYDRLALPCGLKVAGGWRRAIAAARIGRTLGVPECFQFMGEHGTGSLVKWVPGRRISLWDVRSNFDVDVIHRIGIFDLCSLNKGRTILHLGLSFFEPFLRLNSFVWQQSQGHLK